MWDRIFEAVSRAYDGDLQMVDSSSIRVHQHGGNVKKGHAAPAAARDDARIECMGRSRDGLTTKFLALVDANGLLVALKLTEGQLTKAEAPTCWPASALARSCWPTEPTTRTPFAKS